MTDASHLIVDNNPIEMKSQASMQVLVKDFNGDGVIDIFVNDTGVELYDGIGHRHLGKNDLYYLSQPDGTWLESTVTHVTGETVKKGRGLRSFSHGITAGDIDNDGDIDVVTSIDWVGNNASLFCYVNQGDGQMIVRRCGAQFGWEVELGDIDNDGDLDIVFGGNSYVSQQEWYDVDKVRDRNRAYNGILLNDGTGNFFERGFAFPDYKDSNGFTYHHVPFISVADLDGDGDLDVIRSLIGRLYQGYTMSIEENIGNGQFRTAYQDEWCKGPKTKAEWPTWEGGEYGCHATTWKFGDFNEDGFVDIVIDGNWMLRENHKGVKRRIIDGTVYLSTGKFTYDTIHPDDEDYPLADIGVNSKKHNKDYKIPSANDILSQQQVQDEIEAFEAELLEELNSMIDK
jgi:hypothetical protein